MVRPAWVIVVVVTAPAVLMLTLVAKVPQLAVDRVDGMPMRFSGRF